MNPTTSERLASRPAPEQHAGRHQQPGRAGEPGLLRAQPDDEADE